MISVLRSIINSRWGAFIALAFVMLMGLAFALGDVTGNGAFGGLSGGNVARVGNQNVSVGELNDAMENRLKAERQNNPAMDMRTFVQSGGLDATLSQLINRYALAVFGEKYGMAVSKRLVDSEIRKLPGATGLNGEFDDKAFRAFLQNVGVSEQTIRTDFEQNFYTQQILPAAAGGGRAPDSMVLPYASLLLEKRTGELAVIPSAAYFPKAPPSEAVLKQYYAANADKFTVPEKRAISYALFDKDIVDARAKPTEADIAAYYKANAAQYAASQTRDISQIIVPTEAMAKSLSAKLASGQSMAAVASGAGLSVTARKGATQASLQTEASQSIAAAVFAAKQGDALPPARGNLGWFVIRVDAVNTVAARPLAAVRNEILAKLTTEKQGEALSQLTSEIEDSFADGATITDVAKANGLKVDTTPKLLANGTDPANPGYKPVPEMKAILPAAFQMERDGDAQLVEVVPGQRYALVQIADFEEAAPPPLAQIKPLVQEQWALSEGSKQAKIASEQVRKAVSSGKPLREALASLGIATPPVEPVSGRRGDLNRQGQPLSPPLAMLFSMKAGTAKTLQAPGQRGWVVVKLDTIEKGDASKEAAMLAARKEEMTGLLQQEYAAQLVNAAAKDVGVKKNDGAVATLRNQKTSRDNNQ